MNIDIPRFVYGDTKPAGYPVEFSKPWCVNRTTRNWDPQNDEWLLFWFSHGASKESLSERSGFCVDVIWRRLHDLGKFESQYGQWKSSYDAKALEMSKSMSSRQIADILGVGKSTVNRNLARIKSAH